MKREHKKTGSSIWNRNYILCMFISTTAALGHGIMNPAIPVYAAGIGIDTEQVGMIMAAATVVCMFARAFAGGLSDRCSRKKIVFVSLLLLMAGYLTYFFAKSPAMLLVARTFQTVGNGVNNTVLSTMAFSAVPAERLASGRRLRTVANSVWPSLCQPEFVRFRLSSLPLSGSHRSLLPPDRRKEKRYLSAGTSAGRQSLRQSCWPSTE